MESPAPLTAPGAPPRRGRCTAAPAGHSRTGSIVSSWSTGEPGSRFPRCRATWRAVPRGSHPPSPFPARSPVAYVIPSPSISPKIGPVDPSRRSPYALRLVERPTFSRSQRSRSSWLLPGVVTRHSLQPEALPVPCLEGQRGPQRILPAAGGRGRRPLARSNTQTGRRRVAKFCPPEFRS